MSNGTPRQWMDRAKAQAPAFEKSRRPKSYAATGRASDAMTQVKTPRSIIVVGKVEERPATRLDPDPLYVPEDEEFDTRDDFLTLLLVGAILGILVALTLWAPDVFRLMREWVLG